MLRKDLLERGREEGEKKQRNNSTGGYNKGQIQEESYRDAGRVSGSRASFLSVRRHSSSKKRGEAWGKVMKEVGSPLLLFPNKTPNLGGSFPHFPVSLSDIEHLLCTRHCDKNFTCVQEIGNINNDDDDI